MDKILIVEDDLKLRNEIELFFKKNGYEVENILDFSDTTNGILKTKCDIILLDINLPNIDGEYVLKEVRKTSDIPIIMVTSKNSEFDELLSMNYGADDYVVKPFNLQILLAKIIAILKRVRKVDITSNRINCNEFILDISKSKIENKEMTIELTKNELKILHYLVQKRGTIVSREDIMKYLWDTDSFIDDNTLTVNITRLRGKLSELDLDKLIETRRGQGYILK